MSPRHLLLGLSLAANAVLGFYVVSRDSNGLPVPATAPAMPAGRAAPALVGVRPALDEMLWDKLAGQGDSAFAANLRTEGFPPTMVYVLLKDRIRRRYEPRFRALRPPDPANYWESRGSFDGMARANLTPEARAARRAIQREYDEEVRRTVGSIRDPMLGQPRQNPYGEFSPDKTDRLKAILADYGEMSAQVRDRMSGLALREDREQLKLLEQEKRADIAALLTPGELVEFDLRNGPSAATVGGRLRWFYPNEEEYRALTTLQLEFDRQYPQANASETELARRRAAETDLNPAIKAVLGPERYADYEITTGPAFQDTVGFLDKYNFDVATARQVAQLGRSFTTRADAIRQLSLYNAEQRDAQLQALQREANAELARLLGVPAATEFAKRPIAAGWLIKLNPPAAPGPSSP